MSTDVALQALPSLVGRIPPGEVGFAMGVGLLMQKPSLGEGEKQSRELDGLERASSRC